MAITNTQINNAIPEYGDTTPHPTQPNQALMNQLLKDVGDELGSLGTAATRDVTTSSVDPTSGMVMKSGDFGLGTTSSVSPLSSGVTPAGIYVNTSGETIDSLPTGFYGWRPSGGASRWIAMNIDTIELRTTSYEGTIRIMRDSINTTVDSNGFIKQASPIVKLRIDRIEKNGDFAADFEKIATGHYLIKNTLGLAQEGWYIETPKDANGNVKVFVEYGDNGGEITIKTYEPDYSSGRVTAGVPADIPEGRWIDIRLHELPPEPETDEAPIEGEQ